ncbi:hypothetical protein [Brachyspira hyodysenteriae]|uniref:hypothetical protein n=1 Tax=Brachyspira hyodysenteriae TaxID=159 RepID=UPI00063DB764|nr:hypothetical protein [Brachyspira hyodysenteriae]KLI17417.1 hypothetical protein SU45_05680 [Brachyspira hyodysenteriae]KLI34527.1 hypothetical protein SZ48_05020 [Brachyspira hyodysenteriae]KLI52392.1 hypothetical protein SZ42_04695 [Brachyspira hyodysenteriae]KLI53327.1 hypothetical protein SZ43_05755 [Brachyspira hyodysenteriae]KLI61949.1 hypothetical protein SZ46_04260 [Brachyspira hyodysenteriae]
MKNISAAALLFIFSSYLFSYYCPYFNSNYDYFIINAEGLTEKQLQKIIQLKDQYQPKFHELKQKIAIEKIKIDIEMCKEKRNQKIIDESIQLNIEYNKELKKIANDFLKEYNRIKTEN